MHKDYQYKRLQERGKNMSTALYTIGAILALIGVILIYDARPITRKMFGFGDQNEASMGLKIVGFILSIAGAMLIYWNM